MKTPIIPSSRKSVFEIVESSFLKMRGALIILHVLLHTQQPLKTETNEVSLPHHSFSIISLPLDKRETANDQNVKKNIHGGVPSRSDSTGQQC